MKAIDKATSIVKTPKGWLSPVKSTFTESRGVQILSGVLLAQLAVAGGLLWHSSSESDFAPATQLISIDPATIDEIIIDDGSKRVSLTSVDDGWRLDDEHQTIADNDKVTQLLSDIVNLKPGLPVANTTGSHQQLEVAEDDFQRRVILNADDKAVADLYMGTSPGFRKSHIRRVDQDQVYAARLNTFDIPADQNDWLDKNLLAFDSVDGIQSGSIELAAVDDQWSIVSEPQQADTHEVDHAGMMSLVSQLETLQVTGFARPLEAETLSDESVSVEDSENPEAQQDQLMTHTLDIVQKDSTVTLSLSRKGNEATIERSDISGVFALPVSTYEALKADAIEQLIVEKTADSSADNDLPQG